MLKIGNARKLLTIFWTRASQISDGKAFCEIIISIHQNSVASETSIGSNGVQRTVAAWMVDDVLAMLVTLFALFGYWVLW